METQIYRYQRLCPFLSNSTHINHDLCFTDVSESMCVLFSVYVQYTPVRACLEMCVHVMPAEHIWQHSLLLLIKNSFR